MTEWVTQAQVAALAGCTAKAVEYAVAHGKIRHRPKYGPRPTLGRESATVWARERTSAQEAADARARAKAEHVPEPIGPPTDGDVWLDVATVGALLGCSPQFVGRLASDGRIPATRHGRRWWVRRHHAEQYAAARAFARRQRAA